MDTFDDQLQALIIKTCSYPKGSLERQRGLNQIVSQIQQSGKLFRGAKTAHYEDALQQTWLYFCRNLCEATTGDCYNPNQASVTTWLNAYLKRRLQDIQQKIAQEQLIVATSPLSNEDECFDPVDNLPAQPTAPPILEEIRDWLEQEKRQLSRIHVRNRPDINCYILIQYRLPPETSWEALSQKWGVPIPTLSNFYQRECFPRLLNFGKSQGYLD
ncbi:sigma-70 family RNA polymerase sigma factor [Planktothrix pseudagardhii]|uniref:Sigma-70 family RNA polymerase sigma factor n=1 Tax=Planktothrix pseudagardhii TaxID=132604 RepID=A0A9W4GAN7_9CYAN|nr:sigma-70 family RNA polymerase sigma factor [Planktothrix pseudagardhii]CAD5988654.1 hypothetical protein NO713_05757 [Planktothrix pseudagardhii]